MMLTIQDIINYAITQGADDIRFADPGREITVLEGGLKGKRIDLHTYLEDASCIIVLFKSYLPASQPKEGNIAVSPYYIASNSIYHSAKKLKQYVIDNGGKAVHIKDISAREAALRTGGFIGDNGFYFHETFGSFVCIQTILTNSAEPVLYPVSEKSCFHCGKCKTGCPLSAVGNINNCLRKHINNLIPENLRGDLYQLFGCEKCQSACPLNSSEKSVPVEFSLKELLAVNCLDELKSLVGVNSARKNRILSHSAIYAANTGRTELSGIIREISEKAEEPLRSHAQWAFNKLEQTDR